MFRPTQRWQKRGDTEAVEKILSEDKDIAAAILEPLGAATGQIPVRTEFLERLRTLTREHGVILIFDEVVTGFRVSPGGLQAHTGVTPDMTTLAKILAGGLPGGAVVGREDLLEHLDFRTTAEKGSEKIYHPGTFNANPVSAAAGRAALEIIATTDACDFAADQAAKLREMLTDILDELAVPWAIYGERSAFHIFTNPAGDDISPRSFDAFAYTRDGLRDTSKEVMNRLRLAMLINGVDLSPFPGGLLSTAHTDEVLDRTATAFRKSLQALRAEGLVA